MTISNPLADNSPDHEDQSLVLRARSGDRQALEDLVHRHQAWIYNIAVRMLHHPQDAEDATQEILIKVLTRLASFEGRSSFRTWLYRIVVNHVLNMKRGRVEHASLDFTCRCAKKTRGFIQAGHVDPQNLLFVRERVCEVREAAPKVHEAINTLDGKCAGIFRGHPFYKAPDLGPMLRRLVERPDLKLSS